MRALILAAGSSTRLGDLTKNVPKGLLEINGKTIIQRQIDLFKKKGIKEIIIIIGPNVEKFDFKDVIYISDDNYSEHDVLGSLMAARNLFDTDLIMSYSDIVFEESILTQLIDFNDDIGVGVDMNWLPAYENRAQHTIAEADNVLIKDGRIVHTKKNMSDFAKKPNVGEFTGLMRLSAKGAKIFAKTNERLERTQTGKFRESQSYKKAVLTDMLQELIDDGIIVRPILLNGKWCEIDTLEDLENAKKIFS